MLRIKTDKISVLIDKSIIRFISLLICAKQILYCNYIHVNYECSSRIELFVIDNMLLEYGEARDGTLGSCYENL